MLGDCVCESLRTIKNRQCYKTGQSRLELVVRPLQLGNCQRNVQIWISVDSAHTLCLTKMDKANSIHPAYSETS